MYWLAYLQTAKTNKKERATKNNKDSPMLSNDFLSPQIGSEEKKKQLTISLLFFGRFCWSADDVTVKVFF